MTLLGPRFDAPELMDGQGLDPDELARSLAHVHEVSRRLGGLRALRLHLEPLLELPRVRVLDVGAGNAGVLADLLEWGTRRGGGLWTGIGVDLHPQVLEIARAVAREATRQPIHEADPRARALKLVRGDALALPFASDSHEVVFSNLTLHHLGASDVVPAVREMARVATHRVLVGDLERSLPNYLGARVLSATWWRRNRLTRNDGPVSVRRAFTARELLEIGRQAGLERPRVRRHLPFLLVLEGGRP